MDADTNHQDPMPMPPTNEVEPEPMDPQAKAALYLAQNIDQVQEAEAIPDVEPGAVRHMGAGGIWYNLPAVVHQAMELAHHPQHSIAGSLHWSEYSKARGQRLSVEFWVLRAKAIEEMGVEPWEWDACDGDLTTRIDNWESAPEPTEEEGAA